MIKRFCDCCGLELIGDRELFGRRLTGSVPAHQCVSGYRMIFEITTGLDNTWNDGDFCKYCIINSGLSGITC